MSMSKLLITLGLILLMTTPIAVAHADAHPYSGSGTAVVSDAGAMSDKVTFSMSGVTRLESGMAYEGWLVNSDSDDKVSTGVMTVLPDGSISHSWTDPDGGNILAMYDTVAITVETVPDDDPGPSATMAFANTLPSNLLGPVRELVVGEQAVAYMLQTQVGAAMSKISDAQAADDLDTLHASTQEAVDIIDADDGVIALAAKTTELGSIVYQAAVDAVVKDACECVTMSGENIQSWAASAKEDAAAVMAEDDLDTAKVLLNIVNGKLMAAADGIEASDMGGASDAYMSAQRMATFTLPPPTPAAAPAVGDNYVPTTMHLMLFAALMLLATGGALLYRERRLGARA